MRCEEEDGTVYDMEMQVAIVRSMRKRGRYYHSMITLEQIERGGDYEDLRPTYVIYICRDGFGKDYPDAVYKFSMRRDDDSGVELGDGTHTILINAASKEKGLPVPLRRFLDYVHTGIEQGDDALTQRIEKGVEDARRHEKWRSEYVTLQMKFDEYYKQGKAEGEERKTRDLALRWYAGGSGRSIEEISDLLGVPTSQVAKYLGINEAMDIF